MRGVNLIASLSIAVAVFSCNSQNKTKVSLFSAYPVLEQKAEVATAEITAYEGVNVTAPTELNSGKIMGIHHGCGYNYSLEQPTITIDYPRPREISQINSILKFTGLSSNFILYRANIANAVATTIEGKRYIIYDPNLLSYTDEYSGNYWPSMSIIAHEIGHHLSGHTIGTIGSNPVDELEADKYSGFVLYKLGATLAQATAAMEALGSETGSDTHPAKYERIKAITEGWNEANQTRYSGALPPPPTDNPADFCEYTVDMLISSEYLSHESADIWYGEYEDVSEGIITEVDKDMSGFSIRILNSNSKFIKDYISSHDKDWKVYIDQPEWGDNNISRQCSNGLQYLIVPGRRLRFAMVEGCPGCGFAVNGVWYLTYAKALNGSYF